MESATLGDMSRQAALQRLIDTLLQGGLDELVADMRGRDCSWRQISLEIRDRVSVDVSHETLRKWYPE